MRAFSAPGFLYNIAAGNLCRLLIRGGIWYENARAERQVPRQNADSEETGLFTSRDMNFYLNDLDDMKTYPVYFMGESVNALK